MFTVFITEPAESDLQAQHDWWAEHRSGSQAGRWYADFMRALHELAKTADRIRPAAEDGLRGLRLRQLNFGLGRRPTHRAVFTIRESEVVVLRVRHLAQSELRESDLGPEPT